jgi:hypothetical protein
MAYVDNAYKFPVLNYMVAIFFAICILGAISQMFLIIAFIKDTLKCFKNSGTYLIENLAVSDFLTCFLAPFSYCGFPEILSRLFRFCIWGAAAASVVTMVSISIDRFFMVVYPLKHRVVMKGKVVVVWLACIWLLGCAFPAKGLLSFLLATENITAPISMNLVGAGIAIFAAIMYGVTYYKLKKQSENLALENLSNRQQQARNIKQKRFLRTIILVACIAFACIVPSRALYHFTTSVKDLRGEVSEIFSDASWNLFFVNFAVNPLIYVLRLPNYRKTFYLLYCRKTT